MKKYFLLLLSCLIFTVYAFRSTKKGLAGHWTIHYKGHQATADFKEDGSFKAIDEQGGFDIKGKYKVKDNVLYIEDSLCGLNYWGRYKPVFLTEDSVSTVSIEDSCMARKYVLGTATLVRKKM